MRDELQWRARSVLSRQLRRVRRAVFPRLRQPDVLTGDERERAIAILYRLLLGRPIDDEGRQHYINLMRNDGVSLREIAVELAASNDFQDRVRRRTTRRFYDAPAEKPDGFVDVRQLMATRTLSQLNDAAEEYYAQTRQNADRYHAKPLADIHDAPDLLGSFAHLLAGLRLAPGMQVLDFGCGPGWITRFLTQLGCRVTAVDVSASALGLARELFERLPPVGPWAPPSFVLFDGRRLDVPADTIDRIVCFDALHHVPNPAEVLVELGRVLRRGGVAAFSEPGPNHSTAAHSQYEMKNFMVVENDIRLSEIQQWAEAAGFTRLEVAVFSTESYLLPLEQFDDLMAGGAELDAYGDRLRGYLSGHQMFFLHKGVAAADSRDRNALRADIDVSLEKSRVDDHAPLRGRATVVNTGAGTWLPGTTPIGGVNIGVHLRTGQGEPLDIDYARVPFGDAVPPGATRIVEFTLPALSPGDYTLEFDLVSEGVAWFEANGSATVTVRVSVVATRG